MRADESFASLTRSGTLGSLVELTVYPFVTVNVRPSVSAEVSFLAVMA